MTTSTIRNKTVRDSNMELLRIITMLLVMVVHADFRALSIPTFEEAQADGFSVFLRLFTESASIVCVNVFVLLSGWYGIKFKLPRLLEFLFQILFFSVLCFVLFFLLNPDRHITLKDFSRLFLAGQWDYWFVKAYLGLYIFAPVLNAFVEKVTQRQLKSLLVLFFLFQSIYAWLFPTGAPYFQTGYSALSFMGLYMLARYIRLYPFALSRLSGVWDMVIYWGIVLLMSIASFLLLERAYPGLTWIFSYTSPLVIVSAVFFMLFFTKIKFKNKFVNWVASSCFAVYLLHSNSFLAQPYYDHIILDWFNRLTLFPFLFRVIPFILAVFVMAILIDKVRMAIWALAMNIFSSKRV